MARRAPPEARHEGAFWHFTLPESGVEPLLRADRGGSGHPLALHRAPGLHDAFVAIAGEAAARALAENAAQAEEAIR
jgi:ABC-2 type transport system ATP-binding protein